MNSEYWEVLIYFLKLGLLGFGGPLALISSMQKDLIHDRKWMTEKEFTGAFSLIKAMPGPIAFMSAVFIGRNRAGLWGGFLAGFGIVFPAAVLMVIFSHFFKDLTNFNFTAVILLGMQVCALGVILASLKGLVKNNIQDFNFWILVAISGVINYFYPQVEPFIILGFGILLIIFKKFTRMNRQSDLGILFLVCFKAGALVFGSGLAIVPMLKYDVVTKYHWLNNAEFLDALAFGQMTPGPVVITATFIGHHLHGILGAMVATIAIFLAGFIHMMTWFPYVIKKFQGKIWINDFIFGAVAAVVGPIIVTVGKLYFAGTVTYTTSILLIISFIITLTGKIPLWLIIPFGGVIYYITQLI